MAKRFVALDLSNATPQMLADEMGKLSVMEAQVKKLRAFYKEAYFARMGIDKEKPTNVVFAGEMFTAATSTSYPRRFNQDRFGADHPNLLEEYKDESMSLTTRFSLIPGVVNPDVNELLQTLKEELGLD